MGQWLIFHTHAGCLRLAPGFTSACLVLESKTPGMHLRGHGKPDVIQPGGNPRNSRPHPHNPECAVTRAARHLGARQRRKRHLELVRNCGPPDCRRAHRLDAAGTNHPGDGEARPFDPFDRFAQSKENQDKSLEQLLDEFARLRRENLAALQALNLQAEDLARRGRHPALGVVTLAELLATWVVHDLTHVHQLSRVMARQYRDAVGPWSVYLGVLKCAGHSAS